jgi:hypothetical protein
MAGKFRVGEALTSWLLGIACGAMVGAAIALIIYGLAYDPADLPPDGFRTVYEFSALLGMLYGGIVGAIVTPFAYAFFIRKIGMLKAFPPATLGALVGGILGLLFPPLIPVLSVLLFFATLDWAVEKYSQPTLKP